MGTDFTVTTPEGNFEFNMGAERIAWNCAVLIIHIVFIHIKKKKKRFDGNALIVP